MYKVTNPKSNEVFHGILKECLYWVAVNVNPFHPEKATVKQATEAGYSIFKA